MTECIRTRPTIYPTERPPLACSSNGPSRKRVESSSWIYVDRYDLLYSRCNASPWPYCCDCHSRTQIWIENIVFRLYYYLRFMLSSSVTLDCSSWWLLPSHPRVCRPSPGGNRCTERWIYINTIIPRIHHLIKQFPLTSWQPLPQEQVRYH